jgi:hypothetical protein
MRCGSTLAVGALLLLLAAVSCSMQAGQSLEARAKHGATRSDCSGCHERDYSAAADHVGMKPTHCATCHTETAWTPTVLTHHWPLPQTGPHKDVACSGCHKGPDPDYDHTPTSCTSCHPQAQPRQQLQSPPLTNQAQPPQQPSAAGHPATAPAPPPSAAKAPAPPPEPPPAIGITSSAAEAPKPTAPARKPTRAKPERRQPKRRTSKPQPSPAEPPAASAAPSKAQPREKQQGATSSTGAASTTDPPKRNPEPPSQH